MKRRRVRPEEFREGLPGPHSWAEPKQEADLHLLGEGEEQTSMSALLATGKGPEPGSCGPRGCVPACTGMPASAGITHTHTPTHHTSPHTYHTSDTLHTAHTHTTHHTPHTYTTITSHTLHKHHIHTPHTSHISHTAFIHITHTAHKYLTHTSYPCTSRAPNTHPSHPHGHGFLTGQGEGRFPRLQRSL